MKSKGIFKGKLHEIYEKENYTLIYHFYNNYTIYKRNKAPMTGKK